MILILNFMVLMLKLLDLKEGAFVSHGSNAATFGERPAKYACLTQLLSAEQQILKRFIQFLPSQTTAGTSARRNICAAQTLETYW